MNTAFNKKFFSYVIPSIPAFALSGVYTIAVLRAQEVQPCGSTDGVLIELPLPCPLAGRPLEALAFERLPGIGVRFFLKNELQAVLRLVDLGLTAGECPADELGLIAQLLDALAHTADVGVIVGEQIGWKRNGVFAPVLGHGRLVLDIISYCLTNGVQFILHEAFCLYSQADVFTPYEKHHSTVKDACELAEELGVRNLLLYHTEDKKPSAQEGALYGRRKTVFHRKIVRFG